MRGMCIGHSSPTQMHLQKILIPLTLCEFEAALAGGSAFASAFAFPLLGGCGGALLLLLYFFLAFAVFDFILEACQLCVRGIYLNLNLYLFYTLTESYVIYVWKSIKLIDFLFSYFVVGFEKVQYENNCCL